LGARQHAWLLVLQEVHKGNGAISKTRREEGIKLLEDVKGCNRGKRRGEVTGRAKIRAKLLDASRKVRRQNKKGSVLGMHVVAGKQEFQGVAREVPGVPV